MKITKFVLGRTLATSNVLNHPEVSRFIPSFLRRHRNCDYGDTPREDIAMNNTALRTNVGRVMSSYQVGAKKIFVITDGLASKDLTTTVLFAEEY